jgi:3-hydroxyisobutyrate dehydrogenase-like beta-hydroxyacid dehydrogenase
MTTPVATVVGIIGLGIMGGIMARSLRVRGHEVWGHDPLSRCRKAVAKAGVHTPGSNAEVARQAGLLLVSLPSASALRQVVEELAEVPPSQPGQIVVETSTLPLADKRWAAAELKRQGRVMLDAPISGTATPTPEAVWIMYLSGPVAACRKAAAVAQAFTLSAPRVGPLGHGIKLKIAANHLVGLMNVACAEMVTLCRAMGLDPDIALRHMGQSPYIGTGLMRLRMPMMIRAEYEPATMKLGLWQKDMQVIGDMARSSECPTPLLDACAALYTEALAQGRSEQDTAAVVEALAARSRA